MILNYLDKDDELQGLVISLQPKSTTTFTVFIFMYWLELCTAITKSDCECTFLRVKMLILYNVQATNLTFVGKIQTLIVIVLHNTT